MADLGRTFEARIGSIIATANSMRDDVEALRLLWAGVERAFPVPSPGAVGSDETADANKPDLDDTQLAERKAALLSSISKAYPKCNRAAERALKRLDDDMAKVEADLIDKLEYIRGMKEDVQMAYAQLAKEEAKRRSREGWKKQMHGQIRERKNCLTASD